MLRTAAFSLALGLVAACQGHRSEPIPERTLSADSASSALQSFDGERSYSFLVQQTRFGPRNPGSPGHEQCLEYIVAETRRSADTVILQQFDHQTPEGKRMTGTNIIARFLPGRADRILISAHWDTRPWADEDPNPAYRSQPIPGANDGASGVAVLLELAGQLRRSPPPVGVDLAFFDMEDLGHSGDSESWSYGAKYFAAHLPEPAAFRFGINVDMVGDKNLEIRREHNSETFAPSIVDMVFSAAESLHLYQFVNERGEEVYDDHIPLNHANVPCIDLIDFRYPDASNSLWHTMADTPDKCSPESLKAVGTLLLTVIYAQRTDR